MSEAKTDMTVADLKDKGVAKVVSQGMAMRLEAATLKARADALNSEANALLEPFLATYEIDSIVEPGIGRLSYFKSTRTSFDKEKAQDALLAKGVPAKVIGAAFKKATKVSESTQIRFKAEKNE